MPASVPPDAGQPKGVDTRAPWALPAPRVQSISQRKSLGTVEIEGFMQALRRTLPSVLDLYPADARLAYDSSWTVGSSLRASCGSACSSWTGFPASCARTACASVCRSSRCTILDALLAEPGEPVTREALRQRLWPDDTFVDFDNGLNRAINRLRAALGDEADNPRFIETLERRGYRFIAPVGAPEAKPPEEAAAAPDTGCGGSRRGAAAGPCGSAARWPWRWPRS